MNLTWHIVKKDLRALRWPLLVWVALIAAKLSIGIVILTIDGAGDGKLFETLDALSKLLAGLECFGVVLVAALVQEDMLVGTTAFWRTRPISGGRLLAAKLLGLFVIFGVLPVLVTLPWWIGCHLPPAEIAGAAAETVVLHLLVVLLGLLWAVITDGLGRFLLWLLAFVVSIPLLAAIIGSFLNRRNAVISADVATTRFVVVAGLLLLGIIVIVTHQFLTRRIWRSVSMIGAMIALLLLVALGWPWSWQIDSLWHNFLERQAENAWPVGAEPAGLSYSLGQAELVHRPSARVARFAQLQVKYRVDGLPANQGLMPGPGSYTLRWTDGTKHEGWSGLGTSGRDWYDRVSLKKLGLPLAESPFEAKAFQGFPEEMAARVEKEPTAYTLLARFALVEVEAATNVPLAPGSRLVLGALGERIGSVEKDGEEVLVTFVRHRPAGLGGFLAEMSNFVLGAGRSVSAGFSQYRLVNRAQDFVDAGASLVTRTSRIAGVELSWETRSYRAMKANGSSKPRFEAMKALDEAELTRVTFRWRGNFAHEFKVDPQTVTSSTRN